MYDFSERNNLQIAEAQDELTYTGESDCDDPRIETINTINMSPKVLESKALLSDINYNLQAIKAIKDINGLHKVTLPLEDNELPNKDRSVRAASADIRKRRKCQLSLAEISPSKPSTLLRPVSAGVSNKTSTYADTQERTGQVRSRPLSSMPRLGSKCIAREGDRPKRFVQVTILIM